MISITILILSVCALFSFVLELFQPKLTVGPNEVCLCGAPMKDGVCSVEDCVCSGKAAR
jgi:hypothetical protein